MESLSSCQRKKEEKERERWYKGSKNAANSPQNSTMLCDSTIRFCQENNNGRAIVPLLPRSCAGIVLDISGLQLTIYFNCNRLRTGTKVSRFAVFFAADSYLNLWSKLRNGNTKKMLCRQTKLVHGEQGWPKCSVKATHIPIAMPFMASRQISSGLRRFARSFLAHEAQVFTEGPRDFGSKNWVHASFQEFHFLMCFSSVSQVFSRFGHWNRPWWLFESLR